ncbi:Lsr2 family DNA-binding protein [Streptomyces scabiei]|uniref:Lsr2 DNA-binding domain-containing protein n=1 Tax=Streptomyces scabiei TaxID=1930 RepID=A0A100JR05_STRSC|nr:Lsr2 family protein [Streptomyces scabiei]GAQ64091.1 hypothetical protein SsS58_04481 [Streptomyces scabiei]
MTIAALRVLLDEIDTQGGPEAARQWRLDLDPLTGRTPPVNSSPQPAPPRPTVAILPEDPERIAVGKLLKWADDHADPDVQDQAARGRAILAALRTRYAADHELAAIHTEAEQLEQRLAQLRTREAELAPPVKKTRRSPLPYDAAVVRAWARDHNVPCPPVGRVPKSVLDAWREATATPARSA